MPGGGARGCRPPRATGGKSGRFSLCSQIIKEESQLPVINRLGLLQGANRARALPGSALSRGSRRTTLSLSRTSGRTQKSFSSVWYYTVECVQKPAAASPKGGKTRGKGTRVREGHVSRRMKDEWRRPRGRERALSRCPPRSTSRRPSGSSGAAARPRSRGTACRSGRRLGQSGPRT